MKLSKYLFLLMIMLSCHGSSSPKKKLLIITPVQAKKIGMQIWKNECGGKIEGLTSWNEGENVASMGIGHFIWYPEGKTGVFKQTFPDLLAFLESKGKKMPSGILKKGSKSCPWKSREEFLKATHHAAMIELRNYLVDTIDLQIAFIVQRLQQSLSILLKKTDVKEHTHISNQFNRLAQSPAGIYALVDYLNFKGEGIQPQEQYNGHRWGLLQVLQMMKGVQGGKEAIQEFSVKAIQVLQTRVKLAPAQRNEARWLPGWKNRIETYCAYNA